ncbi:hypothetical protein PILCRDRAFT_813660 [Piloderma croceum F 1598]|uniref:Uncharacterized protein n=1 Tax=Piloderma croceum (strain F 1598) TaxID=765440 RepID=A0A0C3GDH3_PILCF|nr:hypothetical protein PILCRDRAFT_813660 [Piloderma croceum F 1598]
MQTGRAMRADKWEHMAFRREGAEGSGMQGYYQAERTGNMPQRENVAVLSKLAGLCCDKNATAHDTISDDNYCLEFKKERRVEVQHIALISVPCIYPH